MVKEEVMARIYGYQYGYGNCWELELKLSGLGDRWGFRMNSGLGPVVFRG